MKTISRIRVYPYPAAEVFHAIDDLGVTGSHMTNSSGMMMGSKLKLEYLSPNRTGLGCKYKWSGKMTGMPMDFTVLVMKWVEGEEKIWETIGESRLIIYSWYRMELQLFPTAGHTRVALSITYKPSNGFWSKLASFLFADMYCIWCVNKMLNDAGTVLKAGLSVSMEGQKV
jgi:hypothetical protein